MDLDSIKIAKDILEKQKQIFIKKTDKQVIEQLNIELEIIKTIYTGLTDSYEKSEIGSICKSSLERIIIILEMIKARTSNKISNNKIIEESIEDEEI